jgi:hypothetical protein
MRSHTLKRDQVCSYFLHVKVTHCSETVLRMLSDFVTEEKFLKGVVCTFSSLAHFKAYDFQILVHLSQEASLFERSYRQSLAGHLRGFWNRYPRHHGQLDQ